MDVAQILVDLLLTCALFIGLFNASSFIFKHKNGQMFALFLLNSCLFIIVFGYLMAQGASSLNSRLNWDMVKWIGLLLFPAVWGFTALNITRHTIKHPNWITAFLLLVSLILITLRLTDSIYPLFYISIKPFKGLLVWGLTGVKGPAYNFALIYSLIVYFLVFMNFVGAAVSHIAKLRNLYLSFSLTSLLPIVGLVGELIDQTKSGLDLLSIGVILGIIVLSFIIMISDYGYVATIAKTHFFKLSEDPLILTDEAGRLLDFNNSADLLFPELDHTYVGKPLQEILIHRTPLFQRMNHPMNPDLEVKHAKGSTIYEVKAVAVVNAWGRSIGRLIHLSDVTVKRRENEELHRLATRDSLTGLLNRRQFLSLSKLAFDRNKIDDSGLAIIIFDLDRFKEINDKYGAAAGDEVLRVIGNIMLGLFRKSDLLGRIGGKEFAVLLLSTQVSDACKLAEKVCSRIRETEITYQDQTIRLTLSGGVAATPDQVADLDLMLKSAGLALRESKENGRDRVSIAKNNTRSS